MRITDHVVVRMRGQHNSNHVVVRPYANDAARGSRCCPSHAKVRPVPSRHARARLLGARLVVDAGGVRSALGRERLAKGRWRRARKKLGNARNTLSQCRKKKAVARWQDKVLAYELEVACLARCVDWPEPEPEVDVAWENAQAAAPAKRSSISNASTSSKTVLYYSIRAFILWLQPQLQAART